MKKTITSDDILGKDAVDPDGDVLGVVMKLHIDKEMRKMVGITIDTGFMRPNLFVGMNYIKNFGVDSVFLNRKPAEKLKGLDVITPEGEIIGVVKKAKAKGKGISEVVAHKKGLHFSKEVFLIAASDIKEIGDSVVLKKGYKVRKVD